MRRLLLHIWSLVLAITSGTTCMTAQNWQTAILAAKSKANAVPWRSKQCQSLALIACHSGFNDYSGCQSLTLVGTRIKRAKAAPATDFTIRSAQLSQDASMQRAVAIRRHKRSDDPARQLRLLTRFGGVLFRAFDRKAGNPRVRAYVNPTIGSP